MTKLTLLPVVLLSILGLGSLTTAVPLGNPPPAKQQPTIRGPTELSSSSSSSLGLRGAAVSASTPLLGRRENIGPSSLLDGAQAKVGHVNLLYPADRLAARELSWLTAGSEALFDDRALLPQNAEAPLTPSSAEGLLGGAGTIQLRDLDEPALVVAAAAAAQDATEQKRRAIEALITPSPAIEPVSRAVQLSTPSPRQERATSESEDQNEAAKRLVFNPTITYPTRRTVWHAGESVRVDWITENIPQAYQSHRGSIMLGYRPASGEGGLNLHWTLASDFPIMAGQTTIHLPHDLPTRHDYIVVLFGDSGNASPLFTIRGQNYASNQLLDMLDAAVGDDDEGGVSAAIEELFGEGAEGFLP
ncbi:hypothetical protein V8E36_004965 [Tilletia maclaganii]